MRFSRSSQQRAACCWAVWARQNAASVPTVEHERDALLTQAAGATPCAAPTALTRLRGIGPELASLLWLEALFRLFDIFDNRRQIATYAGLAPSPWQSGGSDREQGISNSGNPRLRLTMIELAWFWTRHQPGSDLILPSIDAD